jgi:hypothetical protein
MTNTPLLNALRSGDFTQTEAAIQATLRKTFTLDEQIQKDLAKLATGKHVFLEELARTHPKQFAKLVEYLSLEGELTHLAADAAHWQANNPTQGWEDAIAQAKQQTNGTTQAVMALLSEPGIRHERIGTEHPTEPLSPMRLTAQEIFSSLAGEYIRFKKAYPEAGHEQWAQFKGRVLTMLENYSEAVDAIDVSFERDVKKQRKQFTRANNNLQTKLGDWIDNIKDKAAENGHLGEQLEEYLEQVIAESILLIKDVPITAPQKRTAAEENRRHQKYHRQASRNQRPVWELLHQQFVDNPEIIDNTQIFFNGSWEGDADGKPAVTPEVTREAMVLQKTAKIEEAGKIISENILGGLHGEDAKTFKQAVTSKLLEPLAFYKEELQKRPYSRYLTKEAVQRRIQKLQATHAEFLAQHPETAKELSYYAFWNTNNFQARIFIRQNASVDLFITTMLLEDAKTHEALKANPILTKYIENQTFADLTEEEKQSFQRELQADSPAANLIRMQLDNWYKDSHYSEEHNLIRFAKRLIKKNEGSPYLAEKRAYYEQRRKANKLPPIASNEDFAKDLAIDLTAIQIELDRNNEISKAAYVKANHSIGNPFETIVADTENYSDILNRLFVMRIAGAFGRTSVLGLHESKESHQLAATRKAEGIYRAAVNCPIYRKHLETLYGPEASQKITKFNARSDSSKRGGLFANLFIEYYTDKARTVTAEVSEGNITLGVKEGGGHNIYRGAGDVTPAPFKTEQAKHKAMQTAPENFLNTTGNITRHSIQQRNSRTLYQQLKHDLNPELRSSYKAVMNDGAEAYKAFREDLTFYNHLMANASPRRTVEEHINKSARGERTDLPGTAAPSEYRHPYAHLSGQVKTNLPVVGEQRAIGDDAGSSTYSRTETNKLLTYLDTLQNFRSEKLNPAGRFTHVQDLYRTSYGFRNNVIMPMLMGCFRSDHERAFDFLPEADRPHREEGKEFGESAAVIALAETWKQYYAAHGYPKNQADCNAMMAPFRAYEAVNELATRRYLFDLLKAVYPGQMPDTNTPSKEDLLFIFPETIRQQLIAQKAVLDQATDVVSFLHQMRMQGKGLDNLFPADWINLEAIKTGGHDTLSLMLEQAVCAMEAGLRPPVHLIQPDCNVEAAKGFSARFAEQGKQGFAQAV